MRRREFIGFLGSAAAFSPLLARAQQRPRRRIGVLMNLTSDDPEAQTRIAGFMQGLQELGWAVGRNVRVDYRWGGDAERYRRGAEELVELTPDIILASTNPALAAAHGTVLKVLQKLRCLSNSLKSGHGSPVVS